MRLISQLSRHLVAIILPLSIFVAWEMVVRLDLVVPSYAAGPSDVFPLFSEKGGELFDHAVASVRRLFIGVGIGFAIGLAAGVLLARVRLLEKVFSPTLQILAPIPVVVWLPFAVMIFGLGETYKIVLIAGATFVLVQVYTFSAAREIDKVYYELAAINEKGLALRLRHITVPAIVGPAIVALRTSLALSWIVLFLVEYSDARAVGGLGYFIRLMRQVGQTESAFAGVLALAFVAFVIDGLVVILRRPFTRWQNVEGGGA